MLGQMPDPAVTGRASRRRMTDVDAQGRCSGCGKRVESSAGCLACQYAGPYRMRPHMCPVCMGTGKRGRPAQGQTLEEIDDCHPCSGRGIVWG